MGPAGNQINWLQKAHIEDLVRRHVGLTTPELAEELGVSVTYARWAVYECGSMEFYDGNCIRLKGKV